ncbi:TetR family transcriptional regulator [Agrococcus versicolor]|uniref:TetR family transcriptional regulator n=1 Tax=Agrococcus versicolor TaxID=501482 RepID=A0ABN3AXG5_9MICO
MSPDGAMLRKPPVQSRASHRVDELLDAAAAVVDEVGSELLTTTLVAARAGAAVGTLYRYFPDRIAILQGIADRNMRLIAERFGETLATPKADVEDELDALFQASVVLHRSVPGFRALRTGEHLPSSTRHRAEIVGALVDEVLAVVGPRHGIPTTGAAREGFVDCFHVVDALIAAAFVDDPAGDPRALGLAFDVARTMVERLVRGEVPAAP